jgi:hypothetical protein
MMVLFHLWVPCIDIKHLGSPELFYKGEAAELNPFEETGLRVDCQLFSLTLTLHWQEQVGLGFYVQILGLAHESFWNVVAATARAVGHLQKSADVMKLVNGLMKTPEMAVTMQEFSKEMLKVQLFIFMCVSLCVHGLVLGLGQLKFEVSGVGFYW